MTALTELTEAQLNTISWVAESFDDAEQAVDEMQLLLDRLNYIACGTQQVFYAIAKEYGLSPEDRDSLVKFQAGPQR